MKKYRIIIFLFVFCLLFINCSINSNIKQEFTVTAKGISEGIYIEFENIPEDAILLFVELRDITVNGHLVIRTNFHGNDLEYIRNVQYLICPFVNNGHEYLISVGTYNGHAPNIKSIEIKVIANGGIYIKNNPILVVNNDNNSVTLSSNPIFSNEEINAQNNNQIYSVIVMPCENSGFGFLHNSNELSWNFSQILDDFNENEDKIFGDLPVFVTVANEIVYNKVNWYIEYSKTDYFTVSFCD